MPSTYAIFNPERIFTINRASALQNLPLGLPAIAMPYKASWEALVTFFEGCYTSLFRSEKDGPCYNLNRSIPIDKATYRKILISNAMGYSVLPVDTPNPKLNFINKKKKNLLNTPEKIEFHANKITSDVVLRRKQYHTDFSAVTIDFDNDSVSPVDPNAILSIIYRYRWNHIAYSSYSNSEKRPKFRIILPLLHDLNEESVDFLGGLLTWGWFNHSQDNLRNGNIDITSFQRTRYFYLPATNSEKKTLLTLPGSLTKIEDIHVPWFRSCKSGGFLDAQSMFKACYFVDKTKAGMLSVFQIKKEKQNASH